MARSNRGFTLIEIIVTLLLVGIMAAVAGAGIVAATRAFIFAKEAAEISQKNQLAMNRITKSIQNWLPVPAPVTAPHSLTVTRNDVLSGGIVTETYSYSGNTLSLTTGITTDVLCEGLTAFNIEYLRSDNADVIGGTAKESFWVPTMPLSDLNLVRVTMTQAGQSGANASTFVSRVVPMNTSKGDIQALEAKYGTGSGPCFVATAAYGNYDDPAVVLLRQFRDRVLSKSDTGKKFIAWYYREGPALAGFIAGHSAAAWLARIILAPVVGLVFLMLYFPLGLLLIPVMAMLLLRLGYIVITKVPRGRMIKPMSFRGSILIGLIVTMVIMSALGAGMVSMFGASNIGNVASMFQPRANYLAETGFAHAVKEYLTSDEASISPNHNRKFTLENGDSFKIFFYPYWFKSPSLSGTNLAVNPVATVNGVDSFPAKFRPPALETFVARYIRVGNEATPRSYTSKIYSALNHNVIFGGLNPVTAMPSPNDIYPAATAIAQPTNGCSLANAICPESQTTSVQRFYVNNTANSAELADFPPNRGVISIHITSGAADYQGIYTIAYDSIVSDSTGAYFKGLHNLSPTTTIKNIFASGHVIPANAMIVLGKHAEIKVKGIAGTEGGSFAAERMINYDQSLVPIEIWKKTTFTDPTFAGKNDLVGASAYDASVGALKVGTSVDAISYVKEGTPGPTVSEYVSGMSVPQLATAWANSGKTLSYDLQVKMRFSADDENFNGTSTKLPGSYMPGLAFRLTGSTTTNVKFYGLSVMRGIQNSPSDPAGSRDRDGISDYLFKHWPINTGATTPTATQLTCLRRSNADYTWTNWSSTSPRDGRPYIILWQRDVTTNEGGSGWTGDYWSRLEAQMDWLAYKPACVEETTTLYRYGAGSTAPPVGWQAGWYDGTISGIAVPAGGNVLSAIRLVDTSNILQTTLHEGVRILASWKAGATPSYSFDTSVTNSGSRVGIVRDPLTGAPVGPKSVTTAGGSPLRTYSNRPVGYIFPGAIGTDPMTYEAGAQAAGVLHDFLKNNNYRIYPKQWITLMARVFEIKGDFDCDGTQDDKVSVVQVHYADPDGLAPGSGEAYGDGKSIIRRAHPKSTNVFPIYWPEDGSYFTTTVWNEKVLPANTSNFSSKVVTVASAWGWGNYNKKIVERAADTFIYPSPDASSKDWTTVYTDWYKTPDTTTFGSGRYEVGLHTMGIVTPYDRAYFADFAMNIYEKTSKALIPGLRSE